jgi:hypothetical protein
MLLPRWAERREIFGSAPQAIPLANIHIQTGHMGYRCAETWVTVLVIDHHRFHPIC